MADRIVAHCDLNNCYASIELLHRPELRERNVPVVVGGDVEKRHGIVLAKNDVAKKAGIKTGEVIWSAMQKCPTLVSLPPNYELYLRFSQMAREIYSRYTDRVQSFGIDENFLDLTGSTYLFGDGEKMANEIRKTIKREMGVTISVGLSWNRIFAKLGSDYKKPDAVTVFSRDNWKEKIFPLPASDLLYVGPATTRKLARYGVHTIGQLAATEIAYLKRWLGVAGETLWHFANGLDTSPVASYYSEKATDHIKSVGNSCTCPRDLTTPEDVKIVFYTLAESVASRLRENGFEAQIVEIYVRDCELESFTRQMKLKRQTCLASELVETGMELFKRHYHWTKPLRSIGIRGADLRPAGEAAQLSMFVDDSRRRKREVLEETMDSLRNRYGFFSLQRGLMLKDKKLSAVDAKSEHVIHPVSFTI